jgi:hypothetical protein
MDHSRNMINGAISGFFTVFITQPLQVTRTSMMVTYLDGKPYSFTRIIKDLYKQEGLRGFYRGFFPTLLKTPIGSAIYFTSLEHNKHFLSQYHSNKTTLNFLASAIARLYQCVLTNPLLVAVTRFEVIGFHSYNNLIDAIIKIKREEGWKGFTTGLKPLVIKEVPTAAMFYTLYETFKKLIHNFGFINLQLQASLSAILANILLTFLNNPIDVIRTRLQYLHFSANENHNYKGVISGIIKIAKTEGIKGLTVGIIPRVLKRAVGSAIAWTIYETLKVIGSHKPLIKH